MAEPTSTTTLLQAVNRVLLDVGERQVSTITNPASLKAQAYLQDGFVELQNFHDWEWSRTEFAATSWDNDKAVFTQLRRINTVLWQETNAGKRKIPYTDPITYDYFTLESFDSTADASRPLRYTIFDHETIKLNPYPTDTTSRAKLRILGWKYFTPPATASNTFTCPERFIPLLIQHASYLMYVRHLGDINAANALQFDFRAQLETFKSKESAIPSEGWNMYRNRSIV